MNLGPKMSYVGISETSESYYHIRQNAKFCIQIKILKFGTRIVICEDFWTAFLKTIIMPEILALNLLRL